MKVYEVVCCGSTLVWIASVDLVEAISCYMSHIIEIGSLGALRDSQELVVHVLDEDEARGVVVREDGIPASAYDIATRRSEACVIGSSEDIDG